MRSLHTAVLWLLVLGLASIAIGANCDVTEFGARGDGETLCTASIQEAIDRCAASGGGTVNVPPGTYLSGTLVLESGVTLHLEAGATLLGSKDLAQYPMHVPDYRSYTDNYTDKSLIYGEKLERVGITGHGVIDGQGAAFKGPYKVRPYMIRFVECRDVTVEDVTIRNSPMWVQHYLACDDVRIRGITVKSHVNHNNDGIDIDSCRRVTITACNVDSGDDAIVLKSTSDRPCTDVVVSGCVLRSTCNALKMGTESNGGFRNIVLTGCTIWDTRLAGVALEIVDGGTMDRVVVSDITMHGVGAPLFVRLGNRARPYKEGMDKPGIGSLRNVTISNIEATGANATGCAISGLPEARIENLTLSNVRLAFAGGGTLEDAERPIPENAERYPEYSMFGRLPAYGLYGRHITGLKLTGIHLRVADADRRHALVVEDARDVVIDHLTADRSDAAAAQIRLTDVQTAMMRGCAPRADVFVRVRGPQSHGITLTGNDLRRLQAVSQVGAEVPDGAVAEIANRTR
jgi:polygalacturonase